MYNDSSAEDDLDALYDHFYLMVMKDAKDKYEDWLLDIFHYMNYPGDAAVSRKTKTKALKYKIEDDHLFRKVGQRFLKVPFKNERLAILQEVHDGHGHYGIHATWARLYSQYWWPGVYVDVKEYIKGCEPCQLFANIHDSNPPVRSVPQLNLFEQFSIDYVGPINPPSLQGNKYILVAIESFTRWPVACAYPNAKAATTAKFLYEHLFCQFGPPKFLLSDNGVHFTDQVVELFLNMVSTHHKFSSAYRPSTNGQCENLNGSLMSAIKKLTIKEPKMWDTHLNAVLYAYRTKAHEKVKFSPYELLYGQAPRSFRQDALQKLGQSLGFERLYKLMDRNLQENRDDDYDEQPIVKLDLFEPGTKVIRVRNNRVGKLTTKWDPEVFTVVFADAHGTYQLVDDHGRPLKRRVNQSRLRRFVPRSAILTRFD
jgi:hypothetical protein